jgi:hypothetical protein
MSAYTELYIDAGATFNNTITLTDDVTSANLNLAGYTVANTKLKRAPSSANASGNIINSIIDAGNGTIQMAMTAANTSLVKPGRYIFDVFINDGSTVSKVLEGTAFINGKST